MILYKGNTLVEGKHFIYENELLVNKVVTYTGKAYGNFYLFKDPDGLDIVLSESELNSLKLYEHSTVAESDEVDDLRALLVAYFEKGLSILNSNKDVVNKLITYFTEFKNHLDDMHYTYVYSINEMDLGSLLSIIRSYLEQGVLNISDVSMPNLYETINSFIYNLYKLKEGNKHGSMEQE